MKIKFYDTSSLLKKGNSLFNDPEEKVIISSITLKELENIKTSTKKDPDIKYSAREVINTLDKNIGKYQVIVYKPSDELPILSLAFNESNDTKILSGALKFKEEDNFEFVTNDLCLKHIASLYLKPEQITSVEEDFDDYSGYEDKIFSDEEMSYLYTNPKENPNEILINQYLIVRNKQGEVVDELRWTEEGFKNITYGNFSSKWFGNIKPLKGDIYQKLVCDSFINNKISLIKGPAGSGKTFLSLAYLFSQMEKGKIDKIIIFCNTIATKDSARLGFYPGTRDEKLLDSQIGNLLISKIGDRCEVERLIDEQKLILLPMSDVRGFDTSGMKAGVYISEAQNMSISLMKLALQRIGEDSICIIDGDCKTQVDDVAFSGSNNGMRRASKVFRNHEIYGEVTLKNIHRSQIGQIAENM